MLQGHVFHSFTQVELREHGFYLYSQFLGGEAAAIFLFLTGITYGMGIDKRAHLPPGRRVIEALKRARYLFMLAILFRLQMFIFAWGHGNPMDLLRVDVLNLMGAAAALLSIVALAPDHLARFRWGLLAGALMAGLAPVISDYDPGTIPGFIGGYFIPGPTFSIFPWGSFIAFGLACGSMIRHVPRDGWARVMPWVALSGFGLILLGLYCSQLSFSIYPSADFWLDSPALIACKLGAAFLIATVGFLWTEYLSFGASFVRLLGTHSLPVYWVHTELVYGGWFYAWHNRLTPWQCIPAALVVILLMIGMCKLLRIYPVKPWFRTQWLRLRTKFVPAPAPGIDNAVESPADAS